MEMTPVRSRAEETVALLVCDICISLLVIQLFSSFVSFAAALFSSSFLKRPSCTRDTSEYMCLCLRARMHCLMAPFPFLSFLFFFFQSSVREEQMRPHIFFAKVVTVSGSTQTDPLCSLTFHPTLNHTLHFCLVLALCLCLSLCSVVPVLSLPIDA